MLPLPSEPGEGMVLVRMVRAPINPADLLAIEGRYAFDLEPDAPLGAEGVGIAHAVGRGVEAIRKGDVVLPLARGNWCRYRLLGERDLIPVPAVIDIDQAAMLRINPMTARMLLDHANLREGDLLLQNGAGSAVATWVRFFAARRGIAVLDIVRSAKSELPKAIIEAPNLAERVKVAAEGRPIVAALDSVAGEATGRLAECLAPGGRLVLFGHLSGAPISVRSQLITGGGLMIVGFSLRPAEAVLGYQAVRRLFQELLAPREGRLPTLPVQQVFPLSEAQAAIATAREGGRGRILLDLTS